MKSVFADTGYWIALLDPNDTLHVKALDVSIALEFERIITSEMVLAEVLNYFAHRGSFLRVAAVSLIRSLRSNFSIEIISHTAINLFQQALELYEQRPDKS
ncbi:hypothetical protein PN498_26130 [Oscillatoria sp. CS-180]|uniref:type II toxin-antitoxin system VapC family toxin n=1 Tax=Oscillatoria sp. CS-180 TaxID=3021720 RepID=UPI00232CC538|nr:hypothetical protein [Oscillatoria sp. CS-180]MDB9529496.1 hypothetical protein [Oscillatoria sp. CS-180]